MIATLWMGGKTAWQINRFLHLSSSKTPHELTFTVKKVSSDNFIPIVHYRYHVKGKEYQGQEELSHMKYFRQEYLEKDFSKIQKEKIWTLYYNPARPKISSFVREFPYKNTAYSFILIGLLGYFFWLGSYAHNKTA